MADLLIQLTKRSDGGSVLNCHRADGSSTWQRQQSRHAAFFAYHDLTHFAVETELGCVQGFFGLVASGWEIEETTGKSARGPLPAEAIFVEFLVGQFDLERSSGREWTASDVNEHAARYFAGGTTPVSPRIVSDDELARIRARLRKMIARWISVAPGETIDLTFHHDSDSA